MGTRELSRELARVRSVRDRQSAGRLARALEHEELRLAYQPIVDLQSGELFALEALLRWDHPDEGTLLPEAFVPLAEATELIIPIGDWVLGEVSRASARFEAACSPEECPVVSVNVSVRQLQDPRFLERAEAFAASAGVPPARLCLEVTETILVDVRAVSALERLNEVGFRIAVDDFLTGYSSLRPCQLVSG
jgi:EAL domain-containing protein (putative c-di-GMP-specific phosphodiesterase class I)